MLTAEHLSPWPFPTLSDSYQMFCFKTLLWVLAQGPPLRGGRGDEDRRDAWACAGGEILRCCAPQDDISPSQLRRQPPLGKWALRTGGRRAAARAAPTRRTGTTPHPPHGFSLREKPWGTFSSRRRLGGTSAGGRGPLRHGWAVTPPLSGEAVAERCSALLIRNDRTGGITGP